MYHYEFHSQTYISIIFHIRPDIGHVKVQGTGFPGLWQPDSIVIGIDTEQNISTEFAILYYDIQVDHRE